MMRQKIAVITGAGSGIGLALTNKFLSMDAETLVVAVSPELEIGETL